MHKFLLGAISTAGGVVWWIAIEIAKTKFLDEVIKAMQPYQTFLLQYLPPVVMIGFAVWVWWPQIVGRLSSSSNREKFSTRLDASALSEQPGGDEKPTSELRVEGGGVGRHIKNSGDGTGQYVERSGSGVADSVTVSGAGTGEIIENTGSGIGKKVVSYGGSGLRTVVTAGPGNGVAVGMKVTMVVANCKKCGGAIRGSRVVRGYAGPETPLEPLSITCPVCGTVTDV